MQHNLSTQPTASLVVLGASLKATLRNPQCIAINGPVTNTLKQIRAELTNRAKNQVTYA